MKCIIRKPSLRIRDLPLLQRVFAQLSGSQKPLHDFILECLQPF